MRFSTFAVSFSLALLWLLLPYPVALNSGISSGNQDAATSPAGVHQRYSARRPAGPATSGTSEKERQLAEREAALNLKEQELKRLTSKIDARMREFEAARKSMETTLSTRKKADGERYRKMLKLYKALRPEEAAGLIDRLDEEIAMELLNRMDTKTAAKLVPLLEKKRVLKWTRASLKDDL
jgi:flagellar motility protein MotE (MotC chaperone)